MIRLNSNDDVTIYYMPPHLVKYGSVVNSKGTKAEGYSLVRKVLKLSSIYSRSCEGWYTTKLVLLVVLKPVNILWFWAVLDCGLTNKLQRYRFWYILPIQFQIKRRNWSPSEGTHVTTKSDKKKQPLNLLSLLQILNLVKFLSLGNSVLPIRKSTIKNIKDKELQ